MADTDIIIISPGHGISHIFPSLPILCAISNVFCLLLLPGFLKTRILAVVYYASWLLCANTLLLINVCIWRGNVRNIPIYSDIVSQFWSVFSVAIYMCVLCVTKFIWMVSRPGPLIKVADGRRAMNLLDTFLCIGVPLLFLPLLFFSNPMRYLIMEDLGPWFRHSTSIDGFLCFVAPIIIAAVMSIIFTFLSCYNIWHSRPEHMLANGDTTIRQQRRMLSAFQRWRYTLISLITVCSVTYGAIWVTLPYIGAAFEPSDKPRWYAVIGMVENKNRYKEFGVVRRLGIEEFGGIRNFVISLSTVPCIGIQLFLVFGLISEMRATYVEWICTLKNAIARLPTYVLPAWRFLGRLKLRNDKSQANSYNFTTFQPNDILLEELSVPSNFATHSASIDLIGGRGLPPLPTTPAPLPYSLKYSQSAPIHSSRIYRKEAIPRDHRSNPPPGSSRSPKARPTPTQSNHALPRRKPLR